MPHSRYKKVTPTLQCVGVFLCQLWEHPSLPSTLFICGRVKKTAIVQHKKVVGCPKNYLGHN